MNSILIDGKKIVPSKLICVGRNYAEHITELGNEIPEDMVVFNKPNSAISNILTSFNQEQLHYEGELCFSIRNGQISAVGFGIDITKRDLQSQLKTKGLPWERAKAFDGSAVFSPFVSLSLGDVSSLSLELLIDNQVIQAGGVDLMIYKPTQILDDLKSYTMLNDGDVIMTGTPKGVGKIERGSLFKGRVLQRGQELVSAQWVAS